MNIFLALIAATLIATPVLSDVNVVFQEGAPKDRFTLTNVGDCDLDAMSITLDLTSSASGIIFDVTSSGAGVEVFQAFDIVAGKELVSGTPMVADGDRIVTLSLNNLPQGEAVAFTIDVDDTGGGREITVTNGEIRGATASVQTAAWTVSEAFGDSAQARVTLPACS